MSQPARGTRGMAVAPHALAAQSALAVLREGGNAVEAMVAAAATIAVVYPHMNSHRRRRLLARARARAKRRARIDACGAAAAAARPSTSIASAGCDAIPFRGGVAANTVAGTVSGWELALELQPRRRSAGACRSSRLLADAIHYARDGIAGHAQPDRDHARRSSTGLARPAGLRRDLPRRRRACPRPARASASRALAATLERLARAGLDDFYRGDLARSIARDLAARRQPARASRTCEAHRAQWRDAARARSTRAARSTTCRRRRRAWSRC